RLEPVRQRLEASLLDADPESLLLRLVVGADRERRQDAAVEVADVFERADQRLAREGAAGALGPFGEQHSREVAGEGVAIWLVLVEVLLHGCAVGLDARQIGGQRIGPERQTL